MGLFNKKVCDICGSEIGLLGNRKLADGNLCKNCANKLSPWMSDRRQSTVEEIRQHLAYRAQNQRAVANFHPTAVLGGKTKVYIEENSQRFLVSAYSNWRERNPDVVSFSQVIDVRTEVTEHRTEQYHRDPNGRNVPFNPPRYRFSYEFKTVILIDSPFFSEIHFELTDTRPEHLGSDEYRYYEEQADALRAALTQPVFTPKPNLSQTLNQTLNDVIGRAVASVGATAQAAQFAAKADSDRWTCVCGAVNDGNFCPHCGAKRPEKAKVFRCDKCGWTPEDPTNPPKFCPNCGDPFNANDAL